MKKQLVIVCVLVTILGAAFSQAQEEFSLPAGFSLSLPKDGSVHAEWIAPPLAKGVTAGSFKELPVFRIDPQGAVWMSFDRSSLANLASGATFTLPWPIKDFLILEDNALFIASDKFLGFIPPLDKGLIQGDVPQLPFQPICRLPAQDCAMTSAGNTIVAFGYEPVEKLYAVFELDQGYSVWRKLFVAEERISAVNVCKGDFYIACGRKVFKLSSADQRCHVVFDHPLEAVTDVVYRPGTGLFYATKSGIGLVGKLAIEFMKCPNPQIDIRDDALYVYLPESIAVMRLRGIDQLLSDQAMATD